MFGSKLRSWMENHIVRPRKRGNKNKHGSGVSATSVVSCSNSCNNDGIKKESICFTHHGAANSMAGVSPIGSNRNNISNHHNCNSTNSVIASPVRRREVSPIQNHSRYGWQSPDSDIITSPKSDNFLYAPQFHRIRHQPEINYHRDSTKDLSVTTVEANTSIQKAQFQQQNNQTNSSSSFSSLSWSTGSKEQAVLSAKEKVFLQPPAVVIQIPNESACHDCDQLNKDPDNTVHYEEIQTILRHPEFRSQEQRPKSEQLISFFPTHSQSEFNQKHSHDDSASARYGKLLPSRMQLQEGNFNETINTTKPLLMIGSAECLPSSSSDLLPHNAISGSHMQRNRFNNGHATNVTSNMKTTAVTLPFHSLSSPESAYSTGYSTDGTSPGACHNHPPEYYINMRTGTHYFPKSVNSLAIEAQRYRFGLNKIEEMSPIDPLPKVSFAAASTKTTKPNCYVSSDGMLLSNQSIDQRSARSIGTHSPIILRNAIVLPTLRGFESSSPRQRCRIRTNPWYSTNDPPSSTTSSTQQFGVTSATSSTISSSKSSSTSVPRQLEVDASSNTSSTDVKILNSKKRSGSSSHSSEINNKNTKATYQSSSSDEEKEHCEDRHSTLSLTEVECRVSASPIGCIRMRMRPMSKGQMADTSIAPDCEQSEAVLWRTKLPVASVAYPDLTLVVSDEDATLNEMMGKFDESYVYEKETDILSDSDATNCPSELDTGLDAGDECDTDELLDIDFIDTSTSIHELSERKEHILYSCLANSSPVHQKHRSRKTTNNVRTLPDQQSSNSNEINKKSDISGSQRRRKRLIKTRKKESVERKDYSRKTDSPLRKSRETRSVGGTPISLRRNPLAEREKKSKSTSLSIRASSLVFPHDRPHRCLTVAESSRALLKADLEADVKYRQLIQEAESILVSLKSSAQSIPRETPVASPRRVNPLINKRVEMLKNFEGRQQQQPSFQRSLLDNEPDLNAAINKRIELLKFESTSAPNSPKNVPRFSPSKTHITNFINQNAPTLDTARKSTLVTSEHQRASLHVNENLCRIPLKFSLRSSSPLQQEIGITYTNHRDNDNETNHHSTNYMDETNHNFLPEIKRVMLSRTIDDDFMNQNLSNQNHNQNNGRITLLPQVFMNRQYCPQSEPVKRKIYNGSTAFERLQSFDIDSNSAKEVHKIQNFSHGLSKLNASSELETPNAWRFDNYDCPDVFYDNNLESVASNMVNNRKQLILDTLAELKQNLENQSVELNGLNAD